MIPESSLYPDELDSNNNLFEVHDSIRATLLEDYNPGDTSITVEVDFLTASRITPTGLITLTEQCSDIDKRAISFYYSGWDAASGVFSGLERLPEFDDVVKPKKITNVIMNVMSMHHDHLKNALIEIQKFAGKKGLEDNAPFGPTLEGRINFLRRLVLQPKAWFTADRTTGNTPLEVEFKNMSFRLGTDGTSDQVVVTWDFGDNSTSSLITYQSISAISGISVISGISSNIPDPDNDLDIIIGENGLIKKIYRKAGLYDVKLTVENNFGKDEIIFSNFINARVKAPNKAIIDFISNSNNQQTNAGVPPNGPFEITPQIRSPINTLINIEIREGENFATPGFSFGGEPLDEFGVPLDPIKNYSWFLGDDLTHPNSRETKASYSVGGIYDLKLRVDTEFGAYRITNYNQSIDIVENTNLWLWTIDQANIARVYEYGLISETYKNINAPQYAVSINESFLNTQPDTARAGMKSEFRRNNGFAPKSNVSSGQSGIALIYWASGRNQSDPVSVEEIKATEFNGFTGTYVSRSSISRAWNWMNFNSNTNSYFVFGTVGSYEPSVSPTNNSKTTLSLLDLSQTSNVFNDANFLNGAQELLENVSLYNSSGESVYGHYSVYRSTWRDNTGFFVRNDGVGPFFRIKSFYRTEGTLVNQFQNIRKLQDIQGPTKLNGQLTNLSSGVYFLNNSGSISKFNNETESWSTGGPGVNSLLYRNLQDTSVVGFDSAANSLLVVSDKDKRAYLSFDYSPNAFLKFSEIDLTFKNLGSRPSGVQWLAGIY